MKKILQINKSGSVFGGVENYIYTIFKTIDHDEYQFYFLSPNDSAFFSKKEDILTNNGKIFDLDIERKGLYNRLVYGWRLYKFLKSNQYDAIHIHSGTTEFVAQVSVIARLANKKNIIAHSHSYQIEKNIIKKGIKFILKLLIYITTDYHVSCSDYASNSLFFKNDKNVILIKNGIDSEKFKFSLLDRSTVRKELNIDDNTIIFGNVSNFIYPKNHEYILDVFSEINKYISNSLLILIGEGELYDSIVDKSKKMNINDKILFLGKKNDTWRYYSSFDCFLLLSRFEGFPIVGVEAQCSGLPIVYSNKITKSAAICCPCNFVSIDDNPKEVAISIVDFINNIKEYDRSNKNIDIDNLGYSISSLVSNIKKIYDSTK